MEVPVTNQRDSDIREGLVQSAMADGYSQDQAERLADETMGHLLVMRAQRAAIRRGMDAQ